MKDIHQIMIISLVLVLVFVLLEILELVSRGLCRAGLGVGQLDGLARIELDE